MNLETMYKLAAIRCIEAGLPVDDTPNGPIAEWVRRNVEYRPDTEFFIVLGIAGAMADIEAEKQGYKSATDKAATLAYAKHPPKQSRSGR